MKQLKILLIALLLTAATILPAFNITAALGENLVSNPSVETVDSSDNTSPQNWNKNNWGTLDATFSYPSSGNTGSRSIRVDVSNYSSGDAKWYFDPVSIQPNETYTYTTFYKSSSVTQIVVQLQNTAGETSYHWLKAAPVSEDWTQISAEFTAPENAASATVFHVIHSNGFLQTDDVFFGLENDSPPQDTTPPTTSITSPNNGATVSGTQTITADASDNEEVESVQFKVDGNNVGSADTSAPYSINWDSTEVDNGNHEITSVATDTSGLSATSQAVTVNVDNSTPPPPPSGDNLIPNPSMETADGQEPAGWSANKWGTNTANFTYEQDGQDGNRSVRTELTSHAAGDGKWYFDLINVSPNQDYTFKHFYKSNASTQFVLAYLDSSDNWTYDWIETVPSQANWTEYTHSFTTPDDVRQMTVYHALDKVGWLQIDNASLVEDDGGTPPPPPPPSGNVPNPSMEIADGDAPENWVSNSWGSNTTTFRYLNEGRTGDRSVRVDVSDYQSGDAKWFFSPTTSLEPGQIYEFSAWYKTNTQPKIVAMFNKTDGTTQYLGLPNPIPGSDSQTEWKKYTDTFTVPSNTESASILFLVASNGWLQTDDYSIGEYTPVGFNRPLLTITFDDGQEDNVNTALPIMASHGFKSTYCFTTGYIAEDEANRIDEVLQIRDSGHEICSHTVTHPFLTSLNQTDLHDELSNSKTYLENITGQNIPNFVSPYGDYNSNVINAIDDYYRSHRTVDDGYNSKDNFNIYRLRVKNMLDTTTAQDLQGWVEQAQADNTWLILVYHRIGQNPGPYDNTPEQFEDQMEAIAQSGIVVKTTQDALDELLPQL